MKLAITRDSDVPEISAIWEKHHKHSFILPHRRDLIVEANVLDHGKLIAYGQVRHLAEPIIVIDLEATTRQKVKALDLLMNEAFRGATRAGLKKLFAFTRDPNFADLICKHYGYERADLGEFLIREL